MKRAAVFLDRDGVINEPAPPGHYIRNAAEFRMLRNVVDWIKLCNALGLRVIVITNQRGVALGRMTTSDVEAIHRRMREELAAAGADIDDVFWCPHEEGACDCRKPQPGMILAARDKWNLDLGRSIIVGDSECDRQLARNCGMRFVRAKGGRIVEVP